MYMGCKYYKYKGWEAKAWECKSCGVSIYVGGKIYVRKRRKENIWEKQRFGDEYIEGVNRKQNR
jgi:hypothetical protein